MIDRAIQLVALAAAVIGIAAALQISAIWKRISYVAAGVIVMVAVYISFLPEKPIQNPLFVAGQVTTYGTGSPGVMNGGTINNFVPAFTDAQALIDLDNWIGVLSEYQLQQEFDYLPMFQENIDFLVKHHGEWNGRTDIKAYGVFAMNQHCRTKQDKAGATIVDWDPGYICMLMQSEKFRQAQDKLHKYAWRASFPSDIKSALVQMEKTANDNMYLIGNLLNTTYQAEPNLILKATAKDTKYFYSLSRTYRSKLLPLEPQTKQLNALIAAHLQGRR
jgi:hypothetical protein